MRPVPPNTFPIDDYLHRVGLTSEDVAGLDDVSLITRLAGAQHSAVPFENLRMHTGVGVAHDEAGLVERLVHGRLGGVCCEVNGLLYLALTALGVPMEIRSSRVDAGDGFGPERAHMALLGPEIDGTRRLVDIGFSGERIEIALDAGDPTATIVESGPLRYRIEPGVRELGEFHTGVAAQTATPDTRFSSSIFCTRPEGEGRRTLAGRIDRETRAVDYRLIVQGPRGRSERPVAIGDAPGILREQFGLAYDAVPEFSALHRRPADHHA